MRFLPTRLKDALLIETEPREDHRGWFERSYCTEEMWRAGITTTFLQQNGAFSHRAGTLRGMHYQRPPHAEAKLISCTRGRIQDVIIDLRPDSPSHLQWQAFELAEGDHRLLYVPEGFAHGYLTLEDGTATSYLVSAAYAPQAEGGLRWDDPAFAIDWAREVAVISDKDAGWPDYCPPPA